MDTDNIHLPVVSYNHYEVAASSRSCFRAFHFCGCALLSYGDCPDARSFALICHPERSVFAKSKNLHFVLSSQEHSPPGAAFSPREPSMTNRMFGKRPIPVLNIFRNSDTR